MEIKKAKMNQSYNPLAPGDLVCQIIGMENFDTKTAAIPLKYTSPFNSIDPAGGGFTAYPQKDDIILIVKPSNDHEWYYMSTVVGVSITEENNIVPNSPKGAEVVHLNDGRYRSVGLKGNASQHLSFPDIATGDSKYTGAVLTDGTSSKISMIRGPNSSITVDAGAGTSLKMLQSDNEGSIQNAPDSILMEAKGNNFIKSNAGALSLSVGSTGTKINVSNWAPTVNPMNPGSSNTDNGDVDIKSAANCVNIKALGLGIGRPGVFIEANRIIPTSVVQIKSGGRIELDSKLSIDITTLGVIRLNGGAGGYINGATVNLNNPAFGTSTPNSLNNFELGLIAAGI